MTRRSPWGSVRRLPSGRYQARYRVDGVVHAAPRAFRTKRDADAFLAHTRADLERGAWADPEAGKVPLIYEHATQERDTTIAAALSNQIGRAVEEAAAKVTRLRSSVGDT